jgi:hypothetical protein
MKYATILKWYITVQKDLKIFSLLFSTLLLLRAILKI